jgi:poly(A) polymerase
LRPFEEDIPAGHPPPVVVPRAEHTISRANISPNALRVLYRLKEAGYQAFLVGGAVRDLLLGLAPKDFDIATDAHPEQVRKLFRNCRLIGRRFHLAHVRFGMEIVEVATFRAAHTEMDEDHGVDESGHRVLDEHGRILRDNLYGTIEEDVWRRDFTANALYYNIVDYSIWDYVGGVPDARDRVLRLIGDPMTRYREDPVRMLRAARFAGKLGFTLHPDTEAPIHDLAWMLDSVPPARLYDETAKLLLTGSAEVSFDLLGQLDLLPHLMPDVAGAVRDAPDSPGVRLLRLGLENTDQRIAADQSVTPMFLFAVLLWPAILRAAGTPNGPLTDDVTALSAVCDAVVSRQMRRIAVPKRFTLPMRDLMLLQPRFERRSGRRALRLLEHPRFRAAYDFLLLRAASGEIDPEVADWWTRLQAMPEQERIAEVESRPVEAGSAAPRGRPRRRRRRRPAAG